MGVIWQAKENYRNLPMNPASGPKTKSTTHKLPLAVTLVFIVILFPALILLKQAPESSKLIQSEALDLLFIILACATLPLAAITVNSWPTKTKAQQEPKKFPEKFRLLAPIKLLSDRKSQQENQRRSKHKKLPKVIQMPADAPKQEVPPAITLPQWAALPLFQQDQDEPMESLIDLASNPLLIINDEGRILAANQSAQETLELTGENTKTLRITDIIPRLFPDPDEKGDPVEKFSFKHNDAEVVGIARKTKAHTANGNRIDVQLRMSKQHVYGSLVIILEIIPI